MEITVDGAAVDVQLEDEKRISDVVSAMTRWLNENGRIVTATRLDGVEPASRAQQESPGPDHKLEFETVSVEAVMEFNLSSIVEKLSLIEKALSAGNLQLIRSGLNLDEMISDIEAYLAPRELPVLQSLISRALVQNEQEALPLLAASITALKLRAMERILEYRSPLQEMQKVGPVLKRLIEGIEEIPVNLQSGQALAALKEITLFAEAAGKFNRILPLLPLPDSDESPFEGWKIGDEQAENFFRDLQPVLEELAGAFDQNDRILIGDLMEYEVAPRLELLSGFIDSLGKIY